MPVTRTIESGVYQDQVVFKHIIILTATNEPLTGCGPLPDWLDVYMQ